MARYSRSRWRRPPEHIPGSRRGVIGLGAGAAIAGVGSLIGGGIGASGSKSAAKTQAAAAQQAAQLQYQMYQQTADRLQPWVTSGTAAQEQLGGLLGLTGYSASGAGGMATGSLVQPFQPTMAQLSQTPGYQFTLQQGLQAVQNQSSSLGQGGGVMPGGGLGASGPEAASMSTYAENLASTTYQQQFSNYWTQLNNIYNMLSGASSTGANAAAGVGQAGTATAQSAANALQTGAAAQAAGQVGAANAIGGSVNQLGGIANNTAILNAMLKSGLLGGGGAGSNAAVTNAMTTTNQEFPMTTMPATIPGS